MSSQRSGAPRRPRRLVHAHVALERIRQVGAERRVRGLVAPPARALRVKGNREKSSQLRRSAAPARPAAFHCPGHEGVGGHARPAPARRAGPLVPPKRLRIERLPAAGPGRRRTRRSCRTLDRGRNPVHTILVVDDEEVVRSVVRDMLESDGHLLLSDVVMPLMRGPQARDQAARGEPVDEDPPHVGVPDVGGGRVRTGLPRQAVQRAGPERQGPPGAGALLPVRPPDPIVLAP